MTYTVRYVEAVMKLERESMMKMKTRSICVVKSMGLSVLTLKN